MKKLLLSFALPFLLCALGSCDGECCNCDETSDQTDSNDIDITDVDFEQSAFYFSLSAEKKVVFASGNLQYQPSTRTYRFAQQQYETLGEGNANTQTGQWVDLFWGNDVNTLAITINGKVWERPSAEEWDYLIRKRPDAEKLTCHAAVNGINGMLILPDNWTSPEDIEIIATIKKMTLKYGDSYYYDGIYSLYADNNLTLKEWEDLEKAGAVFLPETGYAEGGTYSPIHGYYWAFDRYDREFYNSLSFTGVSLLPKDNYQNSMRCAIRLVLGDGMHNNVYEPIIN